MTANIPKNKLMLKVGILSISTLLTAASAVSGTIPMMAKQYPDQSTASIQALLTIPSIGMVIFVLLSTLFIKFLGKRKTVLLGLILGLVGGIVPFFVSDFHIIQIARFLLGAGNGLYSTSTASLIGDIWSGDEQRNLLGYQSAVQTLGQSFAVFVAGLLLGINWHAAYLVYVLFIPIIILFALNYTSKTENAIKTEQAKVIAKNKPEKKTMNAPVMAIVAIILSGLYFVAIMPQQTDTAMALQQMNVPGQAFFSTSLALAGIVGALITALYGRIYKVLKFYTPVLAMVMGIIGYMGVLHSSNMIVFTISMMIISGSSIIFPYIYGAVMEDVPATSKDFFLSLAKVFNNGGAFISPYAIAAIGSMTGLTSPVDILKIAISILFVVGMIFIILGIVKTNKANKVKHNLNNKNMQHKLG